MPEKLGRIGRRNLGDALQQQNEMLPGAERTKIEKAGARLLEVLDTLSDPNEDARNLGATSEIIGNSLSKKHAIIMQAIVEAYEDKNGALPSRAERIAKLETRVRNERKPKS